MYIYLPTTQKTYRPMTSHEDTTILQNDVDCLQTWSAKWLLNRHIHKCKVMSITKTTACNHDTADYYIKNQGSKTSSTPILHCTEEIDLGIVFDTEHIGLVRMSASGYRGRWLEPRNQHVVSLSKTLYPHCFSRLSCEMSTRWGQSCEGCSVLRDIWRNST